MGYPMTWRRLARRNGLQAGYDHEEQNRHIASDMRRLEDDSRDDLHIYAYARHAGITQEQARAVLDAFFSMDHSVTEALTWTEYIELSEQKRVRGTP